LPSACCWHSRRACCSCLCCTAGQRGPGSCTSSLGASLASLSDDPYATTRGDVGFLRLFTSRPPVTRTSLALVAVLSLATASMHGTGSPNSELVPHELDRPGGERHAMERTKGLSFLSSSSVASRVAARAMRT